MKIGSDTHRKCSLLCSVLVEEKNEKWKGWFRGSFPLICTKSQPILAPLTKPKSKPLPILAPLSLPKSKPPPTSAPLSLLKSKPPYLSLSFFKPRSKPYPQNYNPNLKRKTNKRKPRGRERSLTREGERDKKMKIRCWIVFFFFLNFWVCVLVQDTFRSQFMWFLVFNFFNLDANVAFFNAKINFFIIILIVPSAT